MRHNIFINVKETIVSLFCLLACFWAFAIPVSAGMMPTQQNSYIRDFGYTDEHPLVIVGDWDFRPFEFINNEGQPTGYNIDVLNIILDRLGIPHEFVMQEWHVATTMFKRHEADLIHTLYFFYKDSPYVSTKKYINYYNLKAARRTDTEPIHRLADLLPTDTLFVKMDDYAAMAIANMGTRPFATEFLSPKNGLSGIRHGKYKYYIWGELPLNRKIQELGLDSIVLDKIDIPAGELRIIGYNKELVDIIDDQYTRMEQAGELQKIYDHWFRPELEHDDTSSVALYILSVLLLAAVIVFLLIWFVRQRVGKAVRDGNDLGQMMSQVLNMGDYYVVEWDFRSNILRNKYGKMLPMDEMKPEEFLQCLPPEDAKKLHSLNTQLKTGVINRFDMNLSFNQGTREQPVWKQFYGNAIAEGEKGKPQYILYTIKDITKELNDEQHIKTIASKYKKMFDTNLAAMSFYDADGKLIDINRKMRELCHINDDNEKYFYGISLFSFPSLKGICQPGSHEVLYACQHLSEPLDKLDKYIECRVTPVTDDDGQLVYYIVTNRDVTDERNMYMKQRDHDRQLHSVNNAVKRYEQQLSYLLEESKTFIWTYHLKEDLISLTRSPGQTTFSETAEEYIMTIRADARKQAAEEMRNAMQQAKPYKTILPFNHTPLDSQPSWYTVIGIPIFDNNGQLVEYFGLSRNVTELIQAQEQLRIETTRAEDSGRQKAAFLANMTHEIRTPLNAIVGFSDLLPSIDDADERKELIRIIRNNSDMLLRLINDILEASNIDSQQMEITPTEVDFSQVFDDICQTLEQRVQEPGVSFIKDNPYPTFHTRLDRGRIQQVITNFVTNAVKYTHQGHIKVGYRREEREVEGKKTDGLYIYCEDTGAGIAKEQQASVFERFVKLNEFVQGTGLGLSICKTIAHRCNGSIGVSSEGKGHGSTFWIWIPCPTL